MRVQRDSLLRPILLLLVALIAATALAVSFGSVSLSDPAARSIILDLRLPRVLLAAVIGATLA
ncbi:MAG: iron ABC transporter, partial [Thermoanaerobaculia bacterium]